jgi:Hemerythrin HHE cation binding domain
MHARMRARGRATGNRGAAWNAWPVRAFLPFMDITQLILDDHADQRRLFAILEQIDDTDTASLTSVWRRLAGLLDAHAEAEERFFYPSVLKLGKGAGGKPTAAAETEDAIKDHNEIRDAVADVARHDAGSPSWRKAVADANKANADHMAEEERQGLTDFRQHAPLALRHDLGVRFAAFAADHLTGVTPKDKDPKAYIAEHS